VRTLVWFRSDLRTLDNAALSAATREATRGVIGLFVVPPEQWTQHEYAACKVDLILRTLRELSASLEKLNIPLLVRTAGGIADVPGVVLATAREQACDGLRFNKEYEIDEWERDERTLAAFKNAGIAATAHTDQSILEPGDVRTGEGKCFTVFTPFKKAAIKLLASRGGVELFPGPKKQPAMACARDSIPQLVAGFASDVPATLWPAGESAAMKRLVRFIEVSGKQYKDRRDTPSLSADWNDTGTSRLSPALAVGAISPRQCVSLAAQANQGRLDTGSEGLTHWISEVLWREFYIHILRGFPRVCKHRAFQPATERIRWKENPAHEQAWREGRTGVPIVDAGMRQLLRDGWVHNRVRMIVAMYFTKNLFLDWRRGESWFMRHLVDGFLASNNGGWQWSASTGTDAAPYFRIFNPVSQSQRCDPQGEYIRRYVPELRDVEGEAIHEPWTIPGLLRAKLDYPEPIVDLSRTREAAIEAFREIK
jgi:deoxyribodipyrimidine photo-lyase